MDEIETPSVGQKISDSEAMELALQAAKRGLGWVSPNPAVGCVILDRNGCFLSVGYHQKYGGPHAEVNALQGLSEKTLVGARVFVTLEPCAHYGKTPPCAEALAKLPLAEVIYGLDDPNPLVQGQGAKIIEAAGIKVSRFSGSKEELEGVCEHFLKNMRQSLPFVSLKLASSLDGSLALKNGQSQWITGPESRLFTHQLRAQHDGILVGVDTFLKDNPSLDIRHPSFPNKKNKVLVLDPKGRGLSALGSSKLMEKHALTDIFWIVGEDAPMDTSKTPGIHLLKLKTLDKSQSLDLKDLLTQLWGFNVRSLLVEGGGATISSFINQKIADRIYLFLAPILIGAPNGKSWTSHLNPISDLKNCISLGNMEISTLGKDCLLSARFL